MRANANHPGRAVAAAVGVMAAATMGLTPVAAGADPAVFSAPAADGYTAATRVVAASGPLSLSAAIDGDGHLHVAYLEDDPPSGIVYATNVGGWHKEPVTLGDGFLAQPSLALDSVGRAYIAFARLSCPGRDDLECDDPLSRIHVATNKSGTWVDHARSAGPDDVWPSLAIRGGKLHIAFQRQLWPAGQAGSGVWYLTNAGGWHESMVASGRWRCFLHQLPSIAVAPGGRVWIAYDAARRPADGCNGTAGIRVATTTDGVWTQETVTTDRDDAWPDIALDAQDRPGLIFDRFGSGVRFTRRVSGDWTAPESVSSGGEGDLVFDAAGRPHVAVERSGVQVAVRTAGGWHRTTVHRGPMDYGTYGGPAIVLDPDTDLARVLFTRSEPDDTPSEDELGVYLVRERP